jgi:hypothetical protein
LRIPRGLKKCAPRRRFSWRGHSILLFLHDGI